MSRRLALPLFVFLAAPLLLLGFALPMQAADVALRTNVLWWATATPNLGVDVAVSKHFSIGAAVGYNAFNFPNRLTADGRDANPKWHHWAVAAEGDYWFRQALEGAYVGVHAFGGEFNVGGTRSPKFLRDSRYEGYALGAGIVGGYRWQFGHGWGLDLGLGLGYAHLNYKKYQCGSCGKARGQRSRNYVGPTALSITISYNLPTGRARTLALPTQITVSTPAPDTTALVVDTPPAELAAAIAPSSVTQCNDTVRFVLRYAVDVSRHRPDFRGNRAEVERISAFVDSVRTAGARIAEVRLTGYASPEYEAAHNLLLSERRARSAAAILVNECALEGIPMTIYGVGDDWQGLLDALTPADTAVKTIIEARSSAAQAKEVLNALNDGQTLKRLLRNVYPDLRRTEIDIVVNHTITKE